jgi:hypothetical protein
MNFVRSDGVLMKNAHSQAAGVIKKRGATWSLSVFRTREKSWQNPKKYFFLAAHVTGRIRNKY